MKEEITKIKPRSLSGVLELLPSDQVIFNEMQDKIRKSYEKFGFLPLDTPIIELSEILLAKAGGETEKQIYRFNKGDNDLSLRFDLTVPLAKYVTQYYDKLTFPFRRYQIGKVYRGEKAQKCRFREFYQCDIDIIGDGELNNINDAEIPSIIYATFKELGFDKFTICINNRKILNGLFGSLDLENRKKEILRIIDKFEKIGKENVKKELLELEIEEEKVNKIMEFILIKGNTEEKINALENLKIENNIFNEGLEELKEVIKYIKDFGVPEEFFTVDLTIARGLDYYTGTVYETFFNEYKQLGSVCSGGRYDNLAEYYTDRKMPGVGISIGLTRLFAQLKENKLIKETSRTIADVLIISMVDDYSKGIQVATMLRKNDINTQIYFGNKAIKAQFKYANKLGIPFVIVIGEDEIQNNTVSLKNMETGEQKTMSIEEAYKTIRKNLEK